VNKVYDGTDATTVTLSDNRVAGDVLTTSYTSAAFADKTIGIGKAVNVSGSRLSVRMPVTTRPITTATTTPHHPRGLTITA